MTARCPIGGRMLGGKCCIDRSCPSLIRSGFAVVADNLLKSFIKLTVPCDGCFGRRDRSIYLHLPGSLLPVENTTLVSAPALSDFGESMSASEREGETGG